MPPKTPIALNPRLLKSQAVRTRFIRYTENQRKGQTHKLNVKWNEKPAARSLLQSSIISDYDDNGGVEMGRDPSTENLVSHLKHNITVTLKPTTRSVIFSPISKGTVTSCEENLKNCDKSP